MHSTTMREIVFIFTVLLFLAGCSTPPKPRECVGEFRPVNGPAKAETPGAK